jgi:hypothetical protein
MPRRLRLKRTRSVKLRCDRLRRRHGDDPLARNLGSPKSRRNLTHRCPRAEPCPIPFSSSQRCPCAVGGTKPSAAPPRGGKSGRTASRHNVAQALRAGRPQLLAWGMLKPYAWQRKNSRPYTVAASFCHLRPRGRLSPVAAAPVAIRRLTPARSCRGFLRRGLGVDVGAGTARPDRHDQRLSRG